MKNPCEKSQGRLKPPQEFIDILEKGKRIKEEERSKRIQEFKCLVSDAVDDIAGAQILAFKPGESLKWEEPEKIFTMESLILAQDER